MRKTIKMLLGTLFIVLITSSCGSVSRMKDVFDEITIETVFSEPATGFTSMEEIGDAVYEQQLMLCEAYCETYEKTGYGLYENKFRDVTKSKIMSELNNARYRLNNECVQKFAMNLTVILEEVTDCENKNAYITKRRNEVLEFYQDYREFNLARGNVAAKRSAMLLKYFEKKNEFAVAFLKNHKQEFIDACVEVIEQNSEKSDDLRKYVLENNNIIKALNELFDGTTKEMAKKVNAANRKLAERILKTRGELTDEEKEAILNEIDGGEDA